MQAEDFIYALRPGCDNDDRDVFCRFVGFHLLVHFPTIHIRHHQIEQDKIGVIFTDDLQSFFATVGSTDIKSAPAENQTG